MIFALDDFLLVTTPLANIGMGIVVLRQKDRKLEHILFFLFVVSLAIWSLANFLIDLSAETPKLSLLWVRVTAVIMSLSPWLFLWFVSLFPNNKRILRLPIVIVGNIVALMFAALSLTPLMVVGVNTADYPVSLIKGPMYSVLIIYIGTLFMLGLVHLVRKLKTVEGLQKTQIIYLLVGSGLMIPTALTTNIILPNIFGITEFVRLGPIATLIFVGFTTYGIVRHKLFNTRVLTAQVLMTALVIIGVGQLLISQDLSGFILRLVILALLIFIGISLVKSVIREHDSAIRVNKLNTKLREANTHLKELMEIKTEFLQIASHQLRTPLTSLRGLLAMQAKGDFKKIEEKERDELQQGMLSSASQLNNVVNDLLDAMELEGGSLNFEFEQVNVNKLIQEVIETLKPSYEEKNLTITFKEINIPEIEADEGYLRQVFLNIINNAEKYTEKGGLTITTKTNNEKIEITFTDTGMGIDKEEIPKLFGKFIRGKRSALVHTDGSGLGLYIIKKIMDAHRGKVTLKSKGIDQGTTIQIELLINQPK